MDYKCENKMCSFCGEQGGPDRELAGGLGAMICVPCLDHFHERAHDPERRKGEPPPWESMPDPELLATLPQIMRSASQVDDFATDWIVLLRERGISWAAIGQVLGVSRQAAWERFSKRAARRAVG